MHSCWPTETATLSACVTMPATQGHMCSLWHHLVVLHSQPTDGRSTPLPGDVPGGHSPFRAPSGSPYPSPTGKITHAGNASSKGNCRLPLGSNAGHRPSPVMAACPPITRYQHHRVNPFMSHKGQQMQSGENKAFHPSSKTSLLISLNKGLK